MTAMPKDSLCVVPPVVIGTDAWFPLERSVHVQGAQVVKAFLQGQEIALWRAASGTVQAWENRCPHRSVRLTLGFVVENTLVCRYHGWRYRTDGRCESVPSTPTLAPPPAACARSFMCRETDGLIWVSLSLTPRGYPPTLPDLDACRSFVLKVSLDALTAGLRDAGFLADVGSLITWRGTGDYGGPLTLLLAPQTESTTLVHLFIPAETPAHTGTAASNLERRQAGSAHIKALLGVIAASSGASAHVH